MRMPEEYNGRMPFYLTYPMPNVYQTEKEYERDMERMKELYPKRMKKLLAYVEEECDKMEYEMYRRRGRRRRCCRRWW